MEDENMVEAVLRMHRELREEFPELGCVIQSYLRRSEADCAALATAGSRVRLCKGAYNAPGDVAFTARHDVDLSYVRCLRPLLAGLRLPHAGHARPAADRDRRDAGHHGRPAGRQLRVPDALRHPARRAAAAGRAGARVRVYVPYGSDWYGYLTRRLAERPANLAFFLRSLASRR